MQPQIVAKRGRMERFLLGMLDECSDASRSQPDSDVLFATQPGTDSSPTDIDNMTWAEKENVLKQLLLQMEIVRTPEKLK